MDLKTYTTGIQHIGIPTNDIEKKLGFIKNLGLKLHSGRLTGRQGKKLR